MRDLNEIRDKGPPSAETHHKEMTQRKKHYEKDRKALHHKLEVCINPIDPEQHTWLVNVATGESVSHPAVNVDNATQEGKKPITLFESSWSAGFHTKISRVVTTMSVTKIHIRVGDTKVFNPEIIYARAMGFQ